MRACRVVRAVGARGDGIARLAVRGIAGPGTAPGARVRVRVASERAETLIGQVVSLLDTGDARRTPPCIHFDACGGCSAQQLTEPVYAAWMVDLLTAALARSALKSSGARREGKACVRKCRTRWSPHHK